MRSFFESPACKRPISRHRNLGRCLILPRRRSPMSRSSQSIEPADNTWLFLAGLLDLKSVDTGSSATNPAYRRNPLGDLVVTAPLPPWNGEAAIRPVAMHRWSAKFRVVGSDRERVRIG